MYIYIIYEICIILFFLRTLLNQYKNNFKGDKYKINFIMINNNCTITIVL